VRFQYLFTQTIQSIRRNPLVVASAVVAVVVTLVLVFGAIVVRWSIDQDIGRWDDNVRVIAWLGDSLTVDQVGALQADMQSWPEVDEVVYFSKAQALEEFRELFADQPALIEVVEEDPSVLPASLRIKPIQAGNYDVIQNRAAVIPGVQQVSAAGDEIDALVARSSRMRTFAVGIFVVLGAAALVLIANTIRMAVYARREEIGIMRLVGAGNWFIRVPFLFEGLFEGLVGGAVAALIVGLGHKPIVQMLSTVTDPDAIAVPFQFLLRQSLLVLGFGAGTGLLGSALGMWGTLRD
jgi:cell division transport system permease protein